MVEALQWTPFAFLLFHMAYAAIPTRLREAAVIDGAQAAAGCCAASSCR